MPDIRTIYGLLTVPDWPDDLIIRTLKTYGEWAFSEQLLLAPMLRAEDAFWDVGAFLGTFGLGVAQLAPCAPRALLAVEPGQDLHPFLQQNLERNAPCQARIAPFAVGGQSGRLRPHPDQGSGNAGALAYERIPDAGGEVTADDKAGESPVEMGIPCRSLSDLRGEFGNYDVLKLDVEGMENETVRGDIEYISQHRPLIWAECNEHMSSIALLEALVWLQYDPLYVAFPFSRANNANSSSERIFPMAYEAVLLAAPPDRLADFTGKVEGEDIIVRPVKTSYELRRALWSTPRWASDEWAGMSKAELIAQISHEAEYGDLTKFLNPEG